METSIFLPFISQYIVYNKCGCSWLCNTVKMKQNIVVLLKSSYNIMINHFGYQENNIINIQYNWSVSLGWQFDFSPYFNPLWKWFLLIRIVPSTFSFPINWSILSVLSLGSYSLTIPYFIIIYHSTKPEILDSVYSYRLPSEVAICWCNLLHQLMWFSKCS